MHGRGRSGAGTAGIEKLGGGLEEFFFWFRGAGRFPVGNTFFPLETGGFGHFALGFNFFGIFGRSSPGRRAKIQVP